MENTIWFHRYALVVAASAVLLIWWGAAVTTEGVGMAVPDWPLSFGSVNPEGWWKVPALFLEHGHRLIASLVGLLTLILFLWAWFGDGSRTLRALSAAALLAVIVQGVLGGIRVLRISDTFAIFHGCLAQVFFCLLISIVMLSSPMWERQRAAVPSHALGRMRGLCLLLLAAVFLQLALGATMRHTHRFGLADEGIITTGGVIFPGFADFDLAMLFSHKVWALAVAALSLVVSVFAVRNLGEGAARLRRNACLVSGLVLGQLVLGVAVIATVKSFWVTNFHVLTGLAILASAFALAIKSFAADAVPAARLPEDREASQRRSGRVSRPAL